MTCIPLPSSHMRVRQLFPVHLSDYHRRCVYGYLSECSSALLRSLTNYIVSWGPLPFKRPTTWLSASHNYCIDKREGRRAMEERKASCIKWLAKDWSPSSYLSDNSLSRQKPFPLHRHHGIIVNSTHSQLALCILFAWGMFLPS